MENNLVYKSNALIEASYALTLNEQRLVLACISQIDSSKPLTETKLFFLTVEQARDLFYGGSERDHAYRDLSAACDRLFEREVTLKNDDEPHKRKRTRFVQSIEFDDRKQEVQIRFSYDILPYISQLKDNFTKYRIENMVQLTSTHAIRVYELIVMWWGQNQSYKEIEIDEFKDMLGLGLKYKLSAQLNQRVLTPSIEQINTRTDFHLEISMRKIGRAFTHIQLRFNRKSEATAADQIRKQNKLKSSAKESSQQINHDALLTDDFVAKHAQIGESWEQARTRLKREAQSGKFSMSPTD
jgi:plasmid replication initiation protein